MTNKNLSSLDLPQELKPFIHAIEDTMLDYLQIKITPNSTTWWQSKFGGLPYFPKKTSYPTNNKGEYLRLLAQLNFAEIPTLDNFPEDGILQFYIDANDDIYGLNFDNPMTQNGFRILYFSEVKKTTDDIITNFDFLPNFEENYYFPIRGEFSLEFLSSIAPISASDKDIYQYLPQLNQDDDYRLMELYYNFLDENFGKIKHQLGGYPYFTQSDPRIDFIQEKEPLQLLLQIDSEYFEQNQEICWGDVGICNFFIQPSMMKKLDFSKVLYNWDCT